MAKILLVEDDNNLREIYEARLQAEGYDIVAARDGEEALTVAMKERPDLIISDVMMPKISGFDMLDIIRSTEETKDVKVIMMTALSQAEDKARADKLGADRYLVKSQVTLEDVAKVAREVLNGPSSNNIHSDTVNAASAPTPAPALSSTPVQATPANLPVAAVAPVVAAAPVASPTQAQQQTTPQDDVAPSTQQHAMAAVAPTPATNNDAQDDDQNDAQALSQTTDQEQADVTAQIDSFIDSTKPAPQPDQTAQLVVQAPSDPSSGSVVHIEPTNEPQTRSTTGKKVIQPIGDPMSSKGPDLDKLLEKEQEKDQMAAIARDIASKNNGGSAPEEAIESPQQAVTSASEVTSVPASKSDEDLAEEALKIAAENKVQDHSQDQETVARPAEQSNQAPNETMEHTPEVAISEDGSLYLASSDQEDTAPITDSMNFEESPVSRTPNQTDVGDLSSVESELAKATEQLAQASQVPPQPQQQQTPNIPHTNGTSIDGVSTPNMSGQQPQSQSPQQQVSDPQTSSSASEQQPSEDPDDIAL